VKGYIVGVSGYGKESAAQDRFYYNVSTCTIDLHILHEVHRA